jgi:hypothetical protein
VQPKTILSYLSIALVAILLMANLPQPAMLLQADNPNPPEHVVKLVFIHHSTGENWLTNGYGNLGSTLDKNNYFVSDTNYGWGPNAIGDRTDIPNWPEWFRSNDTPTYMNALFTESGQNASYTRSLSDPGGENQIIMFKSCFPNSELAGNPNDPPGTYEDLTVSGAKYVYNEILKYFATRPDKLFVVITAPPVSNPEHATNARAFNQWLVNDWLRENNYTLSNVAVFDFYNVLSDPNAHHRYNNGQIEHIVKNSNTTHYPSADDHPSIEGSQKATEEFIPMLNIFYHRWIENAPAQSPSVPATPMSAETQSQPAATPMLVEPQSQPSAVQPANTGSIDDFEGPPPAGTSGWEGYFQENTDTKLSCAPESGNAYNGVGSLKFKFDVAASSWASCGFYFDSVKNWSSGQGIVFYLRADKAGVPFDVNLYGGSPGGHTTYVYHATTPQDSAGTWTRMEIPWGEIRRAEWEENAGTSFNPAEVTGFSLGLSTPEQERIGATLWVDNLFLLGAEPAQVANPTAQATELPAESTAPTETLRKPLIPCGGAIALPLLFVGLSLWRRKRN